MTFDKTCKRCGAAFATKAINTRYCPDCRLEVRKELSREYNEERKALTARVNAIAGRVEYNSRTPRPCRCGTPAPPVVGYGYAADGTVTRCVLCTQCGRRGRDAHTAALAVAAWNKEAE